MWNRDWGCGVWHATTSRWITTNLWHLLQRFIWKLEWTNKLKYKFYFYLSGCWLLSPSLPTSLTSSVISANYKTTRKWNLFNYKIVAVNAMKRLDEIQQLEPRLKGIFFKAKQSSRSWQAYSDLKRSLEWLVGFGAEKDELRNSSDYQLCINEITRLMRI